MLINNLIFIKVVDNFLGFLDTGGGMTFQFRNPELNSKIKLIYREEIALDFLPKKVIVFYGNNYWDNKIYLFIILFQCRKKKYLYIFFISMCLVVCLYI
mgnify:CR=1 FL=1